MQKKIFILEIAYLAIIIGLAALNNFLLKTVWEISYLDWYIKNGGQIALVTAFATLIWDVNQLTGLVSARPSHYVSTYLHMIGMTIYSLGTQTSSSKGNDSRPSFLDILLMFVFSIAFSLLLLAWLLLIAPIQYFFILVIGAPARVILSSRSRIFAKFEQGKLNYQQIDKNEQVKEKGLKEAGWVNTSISNKAVTLTNAFLALVLFIAKTRLL